MAVSRCSRTRVELLEAFGLQAAASFALARARRDTEQLHLVSDRERIARDLHDSVIQRLFAVGLSLEAASRLPAAETKQRLQQAVSDIDDTIRSIRSSIFTLESRPEDRPGLRRQVLDVATDAAEALGFEPSVQFDGPVDTVASADVTESLVAVLREASSNVARHAHATTVDRHRDRGRRHRARRRRRRARRRRRSSATAGTAFRICRSGPACSAARAAITARDPQRNALRRVARAGNRLTAATLGRYEPAPGRARRVANTAASVRRSMPSFASRFDT